jgi:hypothetical protein
MPVLGKTSEAGRGSWLVPSEQAQVGLSRTDWVADEAAIPPLLRRPRTLLANCANPECSSGWLHLLRSRSGPVFEDGWTCSAACTLARVDAALRRELEGRRNGALRYEPLGHRHRVPLGLVLMEQGWITSNQLRAALEAQRNAGCDRVGQWLMRQSSISEERITRALSLQWSCPVLTVDSFDTGAMAVILPRLLVEAFGALPLRVAAGRILYLGFEESLDPVVALGLERMLGLRVETGIVPESQFEAAQGRLTAEAFPHAELIESASERPLARLLARILERKKPLASRLVRVHDSLWMRLWLHPPLGTLAERSSIEDVICTLIPS